MFGLPLHWQSAVTHSKQTWKQPWLGGTTPSDMLDWSWRTKGSFTEEKDGGNGLRSGFCCRTSEMSDQATMKGAFCPALSFVVRIASSESVQFVV